MPVRPLVLSVVMPVQQPLPQVSGERVQEWFEYALDELKDLKIHSRGLHGTQMNAVVNLNRRWPARIPKVHQQKTARDYSFLHLKTSISIDPNQFKTWTSSDGKVMEVSESEALYHATLGAVDDVKRLVGDFILASAIAIPGVIVCKSGYIFINGEFYDEMRGFFHELWSAVEASSELKWPDIGRLNVTEVFKWLTMVEGIYESETRTPLGRAVAALSYSFSNDVMQASDMALVWILIGLEALYCDGSMGKDYQLLVKSEILLGKRTANVKRLKEVYNYRSRFLHGDIDFPFAYNPYGADDLYIVRHFENYDIATAILVATLQFMAKHNLYELRFSFALNQ